MSELLGIDLGTTGARAVVVRPDDGAVAGAASSADVALHVPRPLWAEQEPEDWWRAASEAVRGALEGARTALGRPPDIAAVGLTGQMHGVVLLDADARPIGRAPIWCDSRSAEECREITERVGADRLLDLVANPALVGFSAPKLLWLRRHRQADFERARTFLLPKDFLRHRLTGERATDVSDASGTLLFDVAGRRWSKEMLSLLEIDESLLPSVHESPETTGAITAAAASALGLRAGTPVVAGAGDQAAGAVGTGVVRPGVVSSTIGSSGVLFAPSAAPRRDPRGRVHTFCHAVPGAWHLMAVTQAAGLSLRWHRQITGVPSYDALVAEAETVPAGADGLLFLPYLMGERTPHLDPKARGVWLGLTAAHGRAHLTRSILEGVAFSLRDGLDILGGLGLPLGEIRVAGGGAKSPLWRQIQADVFSREVAALRVEEGPAYGAALLAGVGSRAWSSVEEACDATVRLAGRQAPDPARAALYARLHPLYQEAYVRLAPMFPRL